MKYIYLILSFFVLLLSCSQQDKASSEKSLLTLSIQADAKQELHLSEVVDSIVDIIPLETTPYCLIGWIKRFEENRGVYYICSYSDWQDVRLYIFNPEGEFIRRIGQNGQGPGEYKGLRDYFVQDSIIKLATAYKTLTYNLDGKLLTERKDSLYPKGIVSLNDGTYISYSRNNLEKNKLFTLVNDQDKPIKSFYEISDPMKELLCSSSSFDYFSKDKEQLYACFSFSNDTLYHVEKDKVTPYLFIDYGKLAIPKDIKTGENILRDITKYEKTNEYRTLGGVKFTANHLIIDTSDEKLGIYLSFYTKRTKHIKTGKRVVDDLFFKGYSFAIKIIDSFSYYTDGNYFFYVIEPKILLNGYSYYKNKLSVDDWKLFASQYPKLVRLCEQLKDDDNPIILKIKLKEF